MVSAQSVSLEEDANLYERVCDLCLLGRMSVLMECWPRNQSMDNPDKITNLILSPNGWCVWAYLRLCGTIMKITFYCSVPKTREPSMGTAFLHSYTPDRNALGNLVILPCKIFLKRTFILKQHCMSSLWRQSQNALWQAEW